MKIQVTNYTFNKTAKTITFTDYTTIRLDSVLLITNVTSNTIVYNFADSTKGGTVATNVLTLTYDTSSMNNSDKLQIFYDDSNYTAEGSTQDVAVDSDAVGSLSAKMRGLVKILSDAWDETNHALLVNHMPFINTIDSISTYRAAGYLMNGTSAVPISTVSINASQSLTDISLVAAVSSQKIYVLEAIMQAGPTLTNITFNSKPGGSGTAISPIFQNPANLTQVLPFVEHGHFETSISQGLTVTTGAGSTTGLLVKYVQY